MNGRTAQLLGKFATARGIPKREAKRAWNSMSARAKSKARAELERETPKLLAEAKKNRKRYII